MSSEAPTPPPPPANRFRTAQLICGSKKIPKQWFPVGKKVNLDHVKRILGRKILGCSDEELEIIRQKVNQDRVEASTWGKQRVEQQIAKYAQRHGVKVSTFSGLQEALKHNGSLEMFASLSFACYLEWDKKYGWENEMESEYMKEADLEFDGDKDSSKGCFARLFTNRKNETVKALNRIGSELYGKKVKMKRASSEIDNSNKNKKRKKGTMMGSFLSDKHGMVIDEGLAQPSDIPDMSGKGKKKDCTVSGDEENQSGREESNTSGGVRDDDDDSGEIGYCPLCGEPGPAGHPCDCSPDSGMIYCNGEESYCNGEESSDKGSSSSRAGTRGAKSIHADACDNADAKLRELQKKFEELQRNHKKDRMALLKVNYNKNKRKEDLKSKKQRDRINKYKAKKKKELEAAKEDDDSDTSVESVPTTKVATATVCEGSISGDTVEVIAEPVECMDKEDWERVVAIKGWEFRKQTHDHPGLYLTCEYANGKEGECPVGELWWDYPSLLKGFIKTKKFKGKRWERGGGECVEIIKILDHQQDGKPRKLHVLWNNGLDEWANYMDVHTDNPSLVNNYFGDEDE